jgi:eukaryotic-like serine/threonine-protein kinase
VPGFELLRLLGRGAQAEVWLATDLARTEQVALKLRPGPTAAHAPLDREVTALRRIDHPNIVRLHRLAQVSGGGTALVLEHAPAGSLRDLLAAREHLDPPEG